MIDRIRELCTAVPFLPFTIHTSGGRHYHVATVDHISISPNGTLVNLWFDREGGVTLALIHITAAEVQGVPAV